MFELRPFERRNNHVAAYDPWDQMERAFFGDGSWGRGLSEFKTDIQDKGDSYLLEADLPGFKKEDIHVDVDGDTMTIRAERHSEHEDQDKKGNYVRCERSYGSYQRAFDISGVEVANISAQYNDGVLKLNMPKKSAVVNAKQIEIQYSTSKKRTALPSSFLMESRLRFAQSVNRHAPVATKNDQDHCAPAGAKFFWVVRSCAKNIGESPLR